MNPDSEQVLNRFAAGEMSLQQENDFLAMCEIEPARYRRAALAVVEHRRLTEALAAFTVPEEAALSKAPVKKGSSSHRLPAATLTLAASLACVALTGYFLGAAHRLGSANLAAESLPSSPPLNLPPAAQPPEPAAQPADAANRTAEDARRERMPKTPRIESRPADPVADPMAGLLAELFLNTRREPVFSDQAKSKLRRGGWEVEEEPVIYVFSTDDGKRYAVPTHNASLRYVEQ